MDASRCFTILRQLVWSYFDPYIDMTGRIKGYGLTSLYDLGNYDWRFNSRNMHKIEDHLRAIPHRSSDHLIDVTSTGMNDTRSSRSASPMVSGILLEPPTVDVVTALDQSFSRPGAKSLNCRLNLFVRRAPWEASLCRHSNPFRKMK